MSVIRVGSTTDYAVGWENIFGSERKAAKKSSTNKKRSVKKAAVKKTSPKKKQATKKTSPKKKQATKKKVAKKKASAKKKIVAAKTKTGVKKAKASKKRAVIWFTITTCFPKSIPVTIIIPDNTIVRIVSIIWAWIITICYKTTYFVTG